MFLFVLIDWKCQQSSIDYRSKTEISNWKRVIFRITIAIIKKDVADDLNIIITLHPCGDLRWSGMIEQAKWEKLNKRK